MQESGENDSKKDKENLTPTKENQEATLVDTTTSKTVETKGNKHKENQSDGKNQGVVKNKPDEASTKFRRSSRISRPSTPETTKDKQLAPPANDRGSRPSTPKSLSKSHQSPSSSKQQRTDDQVRIIFILSDFNLKSNIHMTKILVAAASRRKLQLISYLCGIFSIMIID